MTAALLLDATSLFILGAWVLSVIAAFLPLPAGKAARAREAFRLALLPGLGAAVGVLAAFVPSLSSRLLGAADHCAASDPHPHLCFFHTGQGALGWHDAAALALVVVFVLVAAWRVGGWAMAARRLRSLQSTHDPERAQVVKAALDQSGGAFPGTIWVVPADQPLCFVTGLRRPVLMIASPVVDALAPEALAAIAAHETAHVRRHDPAARVLVGFATLAHAPGLGHRAAHRWAAAAEGACDAAAAEAIGDHLVLAQALVRYQRLVNGALRQPGPAFCGEGAVDARVRALLETPAPGADLRWPWPWLALALVAWQADGIHQALEGLLHLIHLGEP